MVQLTPVESSNVAAVGHDAETLVLTVQFKNGHTYAYSGVPVEIAAALLAADSVGKYLNTQIKPTYPSVQVASGQR